MTHCEDGALRWGSGTTERDPMTDFEKSEGVNLEFFPTRDLSPKCAFPDPPGFSQPRVLMPWDASSNEFKLLEE